MKSIKNIVFVVKPEVNLMEKIDKVVKAQERSAGGGVDKEFHLGLSILYWFSINSLRTDGQTGRQTDGWTKPLKTQLFDGDGGGCGLVVVANKGEDNDFS